MPGLVAFVRTAIGMPYAVIGACAAILGSLVSVGHSRLDLAEDQVYPGEEGA